MTSPFSEEHDLFRAAIRAFFSAELDGKIAEFEQNGGPPRSFWHKAAEAGLLGLDLPEDYGGPGVDQTFSLIIAHELGRTLGYATFGGTIQCDLATKLLVDGGSQELIRRWAPDILAGKVIQALAMTEPQAGSDATAITSTAVRDGDDYVLNGSKVFISCGLSADLIYVVAKTDPAAGARGISLFLVDGETAGITRQPMTTMGFRHSDVAALFFDDVRVPAANMIGREGQAFKIIMGTMNLDRCQIAARALGVAERAFELTLDHVRDRKIGGAPLLSYQNTQFRMAEMKTDLAVGAAIYHECAAELRAGTLSFDRSAMMKLWVTEMEGRVLDGCLQLFGGSGYMDDMPISRMYTAARLHRIYGGTSEVMKIAIARALQAG